MLESRRRTEEDWKYPERRIEVWDREHPDLEARLALSLIERWGQVAGHPDGEDSAGRQKLRLATPQEMVDRAVEVAALACASIRDRGWVHVTPSILERPKNPVDSTGNNPLTDVYTT